jgi:hypothetical protein
MSHTWYFLKNPCYAFALRKGDAIMGMGAGISVVSVREWREMPTFRIPLRPNVRYDIYRNNQLHQSRWTDERGRPIRDRDYKHSGDGHGLGFPHDHLWSGGERTGQPIPVD